MRCWCIKRIAACGLSTSSRTEPSWCLVINNPWSVAHALGENSTAVLPGPGLHQCRAGTSISVVLREPLAMTPAVAVALGADGL